MGLPAARRAPLPADNALEELALAPLCMCFFMLFSKFRVAHMAFDLTFGAALFVMCDNKSIAVFAVRYPKWVIWVEG